MGTCPPIPHALDVYLNNKSEFPITTFFSIAEILETQMKKIEEKHIVRDIKTIIIINIIIIIRIT